MQLEDTKQVALYGYFRSSSSWRVRIALAFKRIEYEYKAVNLLKMEQVSGELAKLNSKGEVPVLYIDGHYLTQSLPIIEYLEETRIEGTSLLPTDPYLRSQARCIAEIVNSGMQPMQNLSVIKRVGEEKKQEWLENFLSKGLNAIEEIVKETGGKYCIGDEVTIADVCLVPQVYSVKRFNISLDPYPTVKRINDELEKLPEFQIAHAHNQPDTPEEFRQ